MGKIVQLSDKVSNVIAAGEVVESPFNVIKELVENSIDAGATEISVILDDSGMKQVRIIDNGEGMSKEDVLLCFSRHATSKIKTEQDLFRVTTLGFRGEAIPTIASVSEMEIITSQGETGYSVKYDAGELVEHNLASPRKGTEVIVKDLFYNTPARLKYVKNLNTELSKITDYIENMVLSNLNIKFILKNNNKLVLQTSGRNNNLEVISNVYSVSIAKDMKELNISSNATDIKIFHGSATNTRSKRSTIKIILNGRYIKNNDISRAVIEGYGNLIPDKRYPIVIIDVDIDPILVDVNVHPSKIEVRISNIREICENITSSLKESLNYINHIPEIDLEKNVIQETIEFDTYQDPVVLQKEKEEDIVTIIEERNSNATLASKVVLNNEHKIPYLNYLGKYNRSYILAQDDTSLYIIDQHAAQERINYEYYKEKLGNVLNDSYELLIPHKIFIKKSDTMLLRDSIEVLKTIGLELVLNDDNIEIISVPTWFISGQEINIADSLITQYIENNEINIEKYRDSLAESMACKASIRANEDISMQESYSLLDNLRKCEIPFTCPHGRPTMIKFSADKIEKLFIRKK